MLSRNSIIGFAGPFFLIVFIAGCEGDKYQGLKRLESHDYYFSNTGTLNRSLWFRGQEKDVQVVPSMIIDIDFYFPYVALVRQRIDSIHCENGTISAEIYDEYEYWIINVESDSKSLFKSYREFLSRAVSLRMREEAMLESIDNYKKYNKAKPPRKASCIVDITGRALIEKWK